MSDYLDYFDLEYLRKLGMRAPTFRAVLREAVARKVAQIVETGCMRKEDNWQGDGQSTIIWNSYTNYHKFGGKFTTIDIDQEAIDLVRNVCSDAASIVGDSIKELTVQRTPIDLLYLDSFDVDMNNAGPAAMHCMFEFCSAKPRLHSGSIVFIDDSPTTSDHQTGGKGSYVAQYFKQLGVAPFTFGYQIAWIMP